MADFNLAIEVVLRNEGGYVNNALDHGGRTLFGISERRYPEFFKKFDATETNDFTDSVEARSEAKALYKRDYWLPIYADLRDQGVANKLMDMSVHIGQGNSTIIVQKALRALGFAVKQDGVFGRNTLAMVNQSDPYSLLTAIRREQAKRYVSIVQKNPTQLAFLAGWIERVFFC